MLVICVNNCFCTYSKRNMSSYWCLWWIHYSGGLSLLPSLLLYYYFLLRQWERRPGSHHPPSFAYLNPIYVEVVSDLVTCILNKKQLCQLKYSVYVQLFLVSALQFPFKMLFFKVICKLLSPPCLSLIFVMHLDSFISVCIPPWHPLVVCITWPYNFYIYCFDWLLRVDSMPQLIWKLPIRI